MAKRALITGITGQDGSYLAEFLLKQGYEVFGLARHLSLENYDRIRHLLDAEEIRLVEGDLTDEYSLLDVVEKVAPDELYNLAAQSFIPTSFAQPILTSQCNALGVTRLLEAVKRVKPDTRFYQASTSEMYGRVREIPQTERTPFYPRSPYGVAKVYAYFMTVNYREAYGLHASNGILFNHESPRRGMQFVTRKITDGVARIKHGLQEELRMGNLDATRDWAYTGDMVRGMWLMLQQDQPDDYVLATGQERSVRDFCRLAFAHAGLEYEDYVVTDPRFYRPAEVDRLVGDPTKARKVLGWRPYTSFEELIAMMVENDLARVAREVALI